MTEKEAIEKLKETAKQCRNSKEYWENEDCCDCYVEVEDIFAIETVLKLLEKKDAEIEHWKKGMQIVDKDHLNYIKKLTVELEKKDAKIQILMNKNKNLEKECQQNYDAMMDTISDNNNKNLMINLMAELLTTPVHNKEWVIDYYKKKVEECLK